MGGMDRSIKITCDSTRRVVFCLNYHSKGRVGLTSIKKVAISLRLWAIDEPINLLYSACDQTALKESLVLGLNQRPTVYKTVALPLC